MESIRAKCGRWSKGKSEVIEQWGEKPVRFSGGQKEELDIESKKIIQGWCEQGMVLLSAWMQEWGSRWYSMWVYTNSDNDITRNCFDIFSEACQSRALLTVVARTEDDVGRGVLSFRMGWWGRSVYVLTGGLLDEWSLVLRCGFQG